MAFSTKRGRPKRTQATHDHGTPELIAKRQTGATSEPLDHCLHKRLISARQHWCGLHLRWLYTLRYGAPGISCTGYQRDAGPSARADDPEWRRAREDDYKEAIATLQSARSYEAVMGLCVFQTPPNFLNPKLQAAALKNPEIARHLSNEYQSLTDGLSRLSRLWNR